MNSGNLFILSCCCGKEPKIETDDLGILYCFACTCGLETFPLSVSTSEAIRRWNRLVMMCFERESEAEDRWLARKAS